METRNRPARRPEGEAGRVGKPNADAAAERGRTRAATCCRARKLAWPKMPPRHRERDGEWRFPGTGASLSPNWRRSGDHAALRVRDSDIDGSLRTAGAGLFKVASWLPVEVTPCHPGLRARLPVHPTLVPPCCPLLFPLPLLPPPPLLCPPCPSSFLPTPAACFVCAGSTPEALATLPRLLSPKAMLGS